MDTNAPASTLPPQLPPPAANTTSDAGHLRLLSIFHFVAAGLAVLGVGLSVFQYAISEQMMSNSAMWADPKVQAQAQLPMEAFMGFFKWIYIFFGALSLVRSILNCISGFAISARRHRVFSLIVAGINCTSIPLGTVLGVFTFVVLLRDSVREEYETHR